MSSNGVIHLNADKLSEGGFTYTGIHESVHYLAEVNPEGYAAIEKFLRNYYKQQGVDLESEIKLTKALYSERGVELTKEEAMEEIVCNTLSDIATDKKALSAFLNLSKKEQKSFVDFIRDIAKRLKAWADKNLKGSKYHSVIVKDAKTLRELAEMFNTELTKSAQKNNTAENSGVKYDIVNPESSRDVRNSFDEGNLNYSNYSLEKVLDSFGIVKNNDYVHVQKQVFNTLKSEDFFEGTENIRTVVNDNSGMMIEINRKGIKETFNEANYKHIPKELKCIKLLTIRDIDKIIKTAHFVENNVENYHKNKNNNNNGVKYAYLENVVKVDGKNRAVSIAVRKSMQKNMFWVHQIDIKNDTQSLSAGVKHSKTDYLTSGVDNTITHNEGVVNKKYSFGEEDLDFGLYLSENSEVAENLKESGRAVGAIFEKTKGAEVDIFDVSRVMKKNLRDFGIKRAVDFDIKTKRRSFIARQHYNNIIFLPVMSTNTDTNDIKST